MKIYLVGGAVRDELLGFAIKERDWVVVGASEQELLDQGFIGVGKSFPVYLHPETKEEYALARTERKTAGGYHGFAFDTSQGVTLEEDLQRRDLTINALAKSETGDIIDPYGGQQDIQQKVLRHVSNAFIEDPVRILRVARFAARFAPLGFTVAPETIVLMQTMVKAGEVNYLVKERVWKEMQRALQEPQPVEFIKVLRQVGALKIILPEIDALYGVRQSPTSHPEVDAGIHMELVLQQATQLSPDPQVRFAALVHDLGKALTPANSLPKHPGHEQNSTLLVKALCERLHIPKDYQGLAEIVARYHGDCHDAPKKSASELLDLLQHCDAFRRPERFVAIILACKADFQGRPGYEMQPYPAQEILTLAHRSALAVDIPSLLAALNPTPQTIPAVIYTARVAAIAKALKI